MSYYDHINDPADQKDICKECGKSFTWTENGPFYPGGKSTEYIDCPYCDARNGSIRTSGSVYTRKVD